MIYACTFILMSCIANATIKARRKVILVWLLDGMIIQLTKLSQLLAFGYQSLLVIPSIVAQ